ncbi:MAG: Mur ligase family protein [Rubricoccaceae bacterium]|nr:Mur ligase family protein [Rubricoccaceae bacterium]
MSAALTDSRRLTGPSLLLDTPGAVLDVRLSPAEAPAVIAAWERHLRRVLDAVGWEAREIVHRWYTGGASLAFSAPPDALYAATEVNELAWSLAMAADASDDARAFEREAERLRGLIADEQDPAFRRLADAADDHDVTFLWDDDEVSVGLGTGALVWPVERIPAPDAVAWEAVHDVPVALVTGTNGKSTTARMLASVLRAAGRTPGLTTTDRITVGGEILDEGDYSGPGGARTALRDPRVEVGVLEVARGGILRRGLGVSRATAAAVTNVASDHLGEYGIETVEQLAEAKFVVAKALGAGSVLVTNAEDPHCAHHGHRQQALLEPRGAHVCWTALDPDHERLRLHRARGGLACAVVGGHLAYADGEDWVSVVAAEALPCTQRGAARYNVRNALTVLGLARALAVPDDAIARGLTAFRSDPETNPGRGNVFDVDGATVWIDFAHNAHGLAALAEAVRALPARRRLLLFGQAGDRTDADLAALAQAAARFGADRYLVAEMPGYLRGRSPGEVPGLIRRGLEGAGVAAEAIREVSDPVAGTDQALDWAETDDVLVLLTLTGRDDAIARVREAASEAAR